MNRQFRRTLVAAAATAVLLGTTAALPAAAAPAYRAPAVIEGHAPTLVPEGATWDQAHHRFLLGSLRHGTVSAVGTDGSVHTLVDEPGTLVSVIGLHVDQARGRVLLANGDNGVSERTSAATAGRLAGLGAYDTGTGRRLFYVDLAAVAGDGGPHFANDVAFGPDGTAYVTDSLAPIVYRVAVDGTASVLLRDERLAPRPGGYGLNGIVHRDGRLVIGKWDDGTLWQVPVHRPDALRQVEVRGDAGALLHLDGLTGRPDGGIAGVTNALLGAGRDAEVELRSDDHWRTARLAAVRPSADPAPTAVTPGPAGATYVLSARLDLALGGKPTDAFTLRRI
ncbi:gluconolaconase [Kitasatospora sp. NPDC127111]|uniref:gluconolaconase n=1 Tax=Kitasatospora sp. NPDC127111 TaxID=3345363 RepID=UPI00363A13F5